MQMLYKYDINMVYYFYKAGNRPPFAEGSQAVNLGLIKVKATPNLSRCLDG